jgi:hypothetical protein
MKPNSFFRRRLPWLAIVGAAMSFAAGALRADCTVTNTGLRPLNDLGFAAYRTNFTGGLYPGGANGRPPAHEAAGLNLAVNAVQPRNASGNVDTNNGRIVLLSIGMSNTTQEWASKGAQNFKALADPDPSRNPRLVIVDAAQGGQDATRWTNETRGAWTNVPSRLAAAGVHSNMVQVLWVKQALAGPHTYGAFPAHAQALQRMLEQILRVAKSQFPNLQIAYVSSRTRSYRFNDGSLNPEPFAYEAAFATRWLIERQLDGQLNYDPARGDAVAPWISWGPYLWADGTAPRSDGFTWQCADLENDFTHPSAGGGVPKVGRQLLAFFKTDPTATPWFLRRTVTNQPPTCFPNASLTNGAMPLTVDFTANAADADGSIRDVQWTFGDGAFSTNVNPAKTFTAPGDYLARVTATDNHGNTARASIPIRVTATLAQWKQAKFTTDEQASAGLSGDNADPDSDGIRNDLEYLMGLEPKSADPVSSRPRAAIAGDWFTLTFDRYRFAGDRTLAVEFSSDLASWTTFLPDVELAGVINHGPTETVTYRSPLPTRAGQGFLRLKIE